MNENARYILAIAERGSISQAAEAIHISQSALSQRLKNEENQLGVALFNRAHVPIQPTQAGRIYLDWAKNAILAENDLREHLESISSGTQRHLRIGISAPRYARVMSEAAARFRSQKPECILDFVEVGKRELVNMAFANDTIDFAILTPQQPEPSLYASRPICEERYVYVAPAAWNIQAHPEGSFNGTVDVQTIARHPFVMPTFARRLMDITGALFELAAERPRVVVSCASSEMQIGLVRCGVGASIVTTAASYEPAQTELAYYDVAGFAGASYLYYSYRVDRPPLDDERAFVRDVEQVLSEKGLLHTAR